VVIVEGARTPFAKAWGVFRDLGAVALGRIAVTEALACGELEPGDVDEVILGNIGAPADAPNLARVVALAAGIPASVPAFTVNRNCASSLEAIASAAQRIESGLADIVMIGGTESMSNIPLLYAPDYQKILMRFNRARSIGQRLRALAAMRPRHFKPIVALERGLTDPVCGLNMGETAEVLARRFRIGRDDQDRFALESHRRAQRARDDGRLAEEITPVFAPPKFEPITADNGIRDGQTLEALAKLRPAFDRRHGTVTAGNASQITDGAAALVVASEDRARRMRLPILGALRSWAFAGLSPEIMGLGPAFATPLALDRAGVEFGRIGLIEINEAFAAQVIANRVVFASRDFARDELNRTAPIGEIDPDTLNVNGGAIALGHPVGSSGARIVLTLLREMRRRGVELGLATLCAAGGQGGAFVLEAV
jgi:acetyl-CoA C-acetyltransferase/acetyl-CoA acyltransferase